MELSNLNWEEHGSCGWTIAGEGLGLALGSEPEVMEEQELPDALADGVVPSGQPMAYVGRFGLDAERILSEQLKISWIVAIVALFEGESLP
ncbi:unnamed protein product [Phytophthora fragariaefolia]|uniref:Unnamed protein product n=1 Tax=Phytophthora fragariaefolia TaxID=1490495 RepID=A0A9W6WTY2_9STRA|nr:unnamed protein product [Phytophthora fragariaefolia]